MGYILPAAADAVVAFSSSSNSGGSVGQGFYLTPAASHVTPTSPRNTGANDNT